MLVELQASMVPSKKLTIADLKITMEKRFDKFLNMAIMSNL